MKQFQGKFPSRVAVLLKCAFLKQYFTAQINFPLSFSGILYHADQFDDFKRWGLKNSTMLSNEPPVGFNLLSLVRCLSICLRSLQPFFTKLAKSHISAQLFVRVCVLGWCTYFETSQVLFSICFREKGVQPLRIYERHR